MSHPYTPIRQCRLCSCETLTTVVDLGVQALGGRFPLACAPDPRMAPLELVICQDCALVQLRHSVDPSEMFTHEYGYRSGTNATMSRHLGGIVADIARIVPLAAGDLVIDIGCNDGTLLAAYGTAGISRLGIDPVAGKFRDLLPPGTQLIEDFFSAAIVPQLEGRQARAITSISMFYDLERPMDFVIGIKAALAPDGIWVLEQSYLPSMLETNAYDTICHEHLEYYALAQIERLCAAQGLRVFDVSLNACNGGSFRCFVCHADGPYADNRAVLDAVRRKEADMRVDSIETYQDFTRRIAESRDGLLNLVKTETAKGKVFHLYGASTKGNTLLQHCGLDHTLIAAASERSPEKWGHVTPATRIPIISEADSRQVKPDYYLVLPWHFRDEFLVREADFRAGGGKMVFPLPRLEIV